MTRAALAAVIAAAAAASPLVAAELPARAPGLWEMTLTRDGQKTVERKCLVDGEPDALIRTTPEGGDCKQSVSQDGDAYVSQTDCALGAVTMKGRSRFAGDFKTKIGVTFENVLTGPGGVELSPPSDATLNGERVGDCKP